MAIKSKVFVRRAERDDMDTIVSWMEDPDFLLFLYGDPARSPKQIREQLVTMLGRSGTEAVPTGIYLVVDSDELGPLGLLSLQNISWRNRSCSLDLYIGDKQRRNHLISTVAFYCAAAYCFDELNLHRITAFIYSFNEPSWRIFERTGGKRELTLHEQIARDGVRHDIYGYGLLRQEFETFRNENPQLTRGLMENMLEEYRRTTEKRLETSS